MITNKILERIRQGEKALGLNLKAGSEEFVELAARIGLDFVFFDGQHAALTPVSVERLCRVADGFGITPIMRVPDHRESTILSYLDVGIKLIVVPRLETRAQAEALVKYTYFAPKGMRSATSLRVRLSSQSDSRTHMYAMINENTMLVPQLESITALQNLDEILMVDGIDYFTGGSEDLAQSMGLPGQSQNPQVLETFAEAEDKIHAAGKWLISDVMESVDLISALIRSAKELLEKHGRQSRFPWL